MKGATLSTCPFATFDLNTSIDLPPLFPSPLPEGRQVHYKYIDFL